MPIISTSKLAYLGAAITAIAAIRVVTRITLVAFATLLLIALVNQPERLKALSEAALSAVSWALPAGKPKIQNGGTYSGKPVEVSASQVDQTAMLEVGEALTLVSNSPNRHQREQSDRQKGSGATTNKQKNGGQA